MDKAPDDEELESIPQVELLRLALLFQHVDDERERVWAFMTDSTRNRYRKSVQA